VRGIWKDEDCDLIVECHEDELDEVHGPFDCVHILWHVVFQRGEDGDSLERAIVFPNHGLRPFEVDLQGEFGDLMREMDFGNRGHHAYLDVYQCESGCDPRAEIRGTTHKGNTREVFALGDIVEGIKNALTAAAIAAGLPEDKVRPWNHYGEDEES
jgi:hypothetical protein